MEPEKGAGVEEQEPQVNITNMSTVGLRVSYTNYVQPGEEVSAAILVL